MASRELPTLWDATEEKRVEGIAGNSLRSLDTQDLRRRLFPPPVARRLQQPHAMIPFSALDDPGFAPSLLLFHDTLAITGCFSCMTARRLQLASQLIDRGLAVPLLSGRYAQYPLRTFKFLEKYQEDHVSTYAYHNYLFAALNPASLTPENDERKFCRNCLQTEIDEISKNGQGSSRLLTEMIDMTSYTLTTIPSPVMMQLVNPLREYATKGDIDGLFRLGMQAKGIAGIEIARAFDSTPVLRLDMYKSLQSPLSAYFPRFKTDFAELADFCARGLKVDYTRDMPLGEYLNLIQDYRGTLRSIMARDSNPERAFSSASEVILQLNEQVREISKSRRYKIGGYVASLRKVPLLRLILQLMAGGDHGIGTNITQILAPHQNKPTRLVSDSTRLPSKTERFLSLYFQKSLPTVQLWNMQRKISNLKDKHP